MIGISLRGRLGNQMFQYAAAYALARRHATRVEVDTSHYWHPDRAQNFELWRFVRLGLAPLSKPAALVRGGLRKLGLARSPEPTFASPDVGFLPAVSDLPDGTRLGGWFQSPRFFAGVAEDVRRLFDPAPFMPAAGRARLDALRGGGAVAAVHVRRGDYLDYDNFGIALDSYYRSALDELRTRARCTFIVFSDDLAWCRQQPHFLTDDVMFFDDLALRSTIPLNELALMAACDHVIICNSTFSWWAGWLADRPGRQVIMPRQWLKNMTTDAAELSVAGWSQI